VTASALIFLIRSRFPGRDVSIKAKPIESLKYLKKFFYFNFDNTIKQLIFEKRSKINLKYLKIHVICDENISKIFKSMSRIF
jgi:hypothetical protein